MSNEIFVCDCNNHRVQVFSSVNLAFIRQIGRGTQGSAPGCLNYAVGMCLDHTTRQLFVADTNNHRVVVFDQMSGVHVRTIGSQGERFGQLSSPYGVCIDRSTGSLFVADYDNHRVQVFNKDSGEFQRVIGGGYGSGVGQMNQPIVLCIDEETGVLFVADYSNNRVQVFNKDLGTFIRQIGGDVTGLGSDALNGPRGLCIDSASGLLFIADREVRTLFLKRSIVTSPRFYHCQIYWRELSYVDTFTVLRCSSVSSSRLTCLS
jgi:DNA-binding beta-propeller fold protein YncE